MRDLLVRIRCLAAHVETSPGFMKQQERKKPDFVLHKPLNEPVERTSLSAQPVSATADADAHADAQARFDVAALNIRCIRLEFCLRLRPRSSDGWKEVSFSQTRPGLNHETLVAHCCHRTLVGGR